MQTKSYQIKDLKKQFQKSAFKKVNILFIYEFDECDHMRQGEPVTQQTAEHQSVRTSQPEQVVGCHEQQDVLHPVQFLLKGQLKDT